MIKVQTLRLRGLFASPLLALVACSGSPLHFGGVTANPEGSALTTEPVSSTRAVPSVPSVPTVAEDTAGAAAQVQEPQSQDPQNRAKEQLQRALEAMRRSYQAKLFADARREAALALEFDVNNTEAREVLLSCDAILRDKNDPAGLLPKFEQGVLTDRIYQERERARISELMRQGEALLLKESLPGYEQAVDKFQRAVLLLRHSRFGDANKGLRKQAEIRLAAAEELRRQAAAAALKAQAEKSQAEVDQKKQEAVEARELSISRILDQANLQFQNGEFAKALENVDKALLRDPSNPTAINLRDLADRARHESALQYAKDRWLEEWNKTFSELAHSNLPQIDTVVFDPVIWAEVSQRKPAAFTTPTDIDTPENQAIIRILEETKLEHNFSSATVDDWANYYANLTKVTFFVTQDVRDMDPDQTTLNDFRLPNRSVANAMQAIQSQTGVAYRVRNGMVHLVSPENATGILYLHSYQVADLIQGVPSHSGPNLRLPVPGDDLPLFPEIDEEPLPAVVDEGRLQELLSATVAPDRWDGSPFSMQLLGGILNVRADAETQQEVEHLLNELRRHVGIQIDVEARFLKVDDNFLEDLGIDLRGLGNQASQGLAGRGLEDPLTSNANFDDFGPSQQQNSAVPGIVGTGTEPGIFFDDGLDGDFMARTEGLYDGTLGGRHGSATNAGGLSLQYAFLDDTQVELVLRAVSKQERSEQVDAPRLLVYNNTRASMHHLRNISYIRDFEVEIAQAAAVANPVVGTVHDGVSLDVRPVVDADLRFITMELRPTVMTLQLPIPTFTTTLGVGQPISIQLPEVTLQRVRTTVTVPDGGSMLLGGMRLVERQNLRSTVPLLGSLPGLSWLFSRNGTSVINRKILILIRAKIVLMDELEPDAVPLLDGSLLSTR